MMISAGEMSILGLLRRLTFLIWALSSFVVWGVFFFMLDIKKTFGCANSQTAHILNKDMNSSQSEHLAGDSLQHSKMCL